MPAAIPLPSANPDTPASRGRPHLDRLPQRSDFLRLQGGRKQVTPGFILQAAPRPQDLAACVHPRVGFTVTKRVGNAVIRNRVRRRLRALAREIMLAGARADLDYVLIGRQEAIQRDYARMADELRMALRRLKADRPPAGPTT